MTTSYRKYTRKERGNRTCGYGRTGAHRKKGKKGGTGTTTGICKHKWQYYLVQKKLGFPDPNWIRGKKGFNMPPSILRIHAIHPINIKDVEICIDGWVSDGVAQKKGDLYTCVLADAGFNKLLGTGSVTKKMEITVDRATNKAIEKFKEAKCKLTILKPAEKEEEKKAPAKEEPKAIEGKKEKAKK